ncbi:MAG: LysM peptidoglycan-binding domain-containing protein [Desulfurivibrionaceae bacterium]|nr:LysM peptidoglycan-binding domain-containing protein [Desulfurivibrionaceae bacterium]
MIIFSLADKTVRDGGAGATVKIVCVFAVVLLWGCSPALQKVSSSPPPPATPDPLGRVELVYLLEDSLGASLGKMVEEDLEQALEEELDPLASEEIPLPSPAETVTLENDDRGDTEQLEIVKPEIEYDFPITINSHVEFFLDKFQNSMHKTFRTWLERSGRYLPMIQEELKNADMPLDLAYLPMIESGYRLTAYSRAKAVGPWQFMHGTGRAYDLAINNYIDERRDPIKSTKAAIRFLSDLYAEFDSWELAVAAYNAGGGRVRRAIQRTDSRDFWQLIKGKHLHKETKYYVPKLIAAIMIAKDPESYGFKDLVYKSPLAFETLEVPRWTTMQAVSVAGDIPLEEIHDLNRQLRRAITPAGENHYTIKVPLGKKELIAKNLPRVKATISTAYKTHVIAKGDTVSKICRKYKINKKTLLKANDLRSTELVAGKRLRIPYRATSYKLIDESLIAAGLKPAEMLPENLVIHEIKPGETISELARRYNVPAHMIAAWNGLENLNRIRAGQQLAFYLQDSDNIEPNLIATTAKKTGPDAREAGGKNRRPNYYHVIGGDTLWAIAKKFQTTPEQLRRWNNLESDIIFPGHRLLLKPNEDIDV